MQHIFIELWSFKDRWRNLTMPERAAYLEKLQPAIQQMQEQGVEILAWGYNEKSVDQRANYDVFAVYRLPNSEVFDVFQKAIAGSGWYDYFDQVNAGGVALNPPAILFDHTLLKAAPAFKDISPTMAGERKTVTVDGLKMSWVSQGKGRPIVFLHGDVAQAYLWRNVMPFAAQAGHAIGIDLIGMGHSDKLPNSGNGVYTFDTHYRFLEQALAEMGVSKDVIFVGHDWGCNLAFEWAKNHPGAVAGVAYCEPVTPPFDWDDWTPPMIHPMFRALKSEQGEQVQLQENGFVEFMRMGVLRVMSQKELDAYRAPYAQPGEDRRPPLEWARQVPLGGANPEVVARIEAHTSWMAQSDLPKLLFRGEPGALTVGRRLDRLRSWHAHQEVAVRGIHWLPEDDPEVIGQALLDWLRAISSKTV
jgi:haloalkane dehalogenase